MELLITEKNELIPTLCLNMIVKNESKIITRLFDSVINIIDSYCICDTGSTDNTCDIITYYFKNKNIPGKIIREPFKNFEYNRNFSLKGCFGMSDYILFLDADMILNVKNFNKKDLVVADHFSILQGNDNFYYQNVRIVKNNGLYSYVGVTHEYINTPPNTRNGIITKNELFITDYGDGGSKNDKAERDIRLLTEGIVNEPHNSMRYLFYLANTYRDCGQNENAIETYKKRILMGGWNEEIWYSLYSIGLCYKRMDKISDAIFYWLEAYEKHPHRIENIYEITDYYRCNSQYKVAFAFFNMAMNVLENNKINNIDKDSFLFLNNDTYTFKFYYLYILIAYYNGITNINDYLVKFFNYCNFSDMKNNFIVNMKFYKDILTPQNLLDHSFSITKKINNENIHLYSSSTSIIPCPNNHNEYFINYRLVNYIIEKNSGRYLNCDKQIITYNKFCHVDNNFNPILSTNSINEKIFESKETTRQYVGVEDLKIYYDKYTDSIKFIGTGFHENNCIGIVSGDYNIDNIFIEPNEIKSNFTNNICEKNWVFFDYKNSTHIVYKWYPLQICKINHNNTLDLIETKNSMPLIFENIRGSTCGFTFNNEIWFISHLVSYEDPRCYYHIFVIFDLDMNLKRYSAPFCFEGQPIEYCIGLIVEEDRVIISYSVWDNKSKIAIYDKKYIDSKISYL